MGELTRRTVEAAHQLLGRAAAEQAGILSGDNPTHYNASDPIRLWVIQVAIIVAMTQLLSLFLSRIRQPRVIAEVIGGVILGPTVMGRIPHFRATIFPEEGMAMLTLTSTIGLVLFLFLVGLEIDTKIIRRNAKASSAVSVAGLLVPLGLGAALGVGIFREFVQPINPNVNFGYFLLFTAVAIGITAFPVLCRILTELKLLDTSVGVVVLSAGVGNDVVGWILLALTVALVNATNGLNALWVLLCCIGFIILLLLPGKWAYVWLARRTGSLEQGSPTPFMMTITLFVVFGSAFFTDVIGVHAIFGGFLAGLIIPHENGFAISLVEKLEDLVSILFLPIYFTLSGLRTNLGLLDNGKTWGYVIIICLVAFSSKFFACGIAAKSFGFNWRESAAIGSLMSCKGLVELIVLNIGLQANILDPRTFSMFVVHALVLTFMTTPLVILFYPERLRVHEHIGAKHKPADDGELGTRHRTSLDDEFKTKFAIVLERFEQLPIAMTLSQLLQVPFVQAPSTSYRIDSKSMEAGLSPIPPEPQQSISIDTLRLIELTNRTSAVLKSQEAETLLWNDPIITVFRTFGHLNRLSVSAALSVVNYEQFPSAIADHVVETGSQMVIIPWCNTSITSPADEDRPGASASNVTRLTSFDQTNSVVYSEFVRKIFSTTPTDTAVFVDRGIHPASYNKIAEQHLFLPFFGGPDDRLALSFLVQLCANPSVHATVVRITKTDDALTPTTTNQDAKAALTHTTVTADTVYGPQNTQTRLQSDTADNIIWERYSGSSISHPPNVESALSRVTFDVCETTKPLHSVIENVNKAINSSHSQTRNAIVLLGRSRRMAVDSHQAELLQLILERGNSLPSVVPKALGDVGAALVTSGVSADLLVVQAAV